MSTDTRSILAERTNGEHVLIEGIPTNAKVTFGKLHPGTKEYGGSSVLRIYTAASNQLAVVTDVVSFRDLSLTVSRQVRKSNGRSKFVIDTDGNKRRNEEYSETLVWVKDDVTIPA